MERVRAAILEVAGYFDSIARQADARLNHEAGDIFRAQAMLAKDPTLLMVFENMLAAGYETAEAAVEATLKDFEHVLQTAATASMQERAIDITELRNSILDCLARKHDYVRRDYVECGQCRYCRVGRCRNRQDHILVATQLLSGTAISIGSYTRGFIVEKGGPSSHAAILARMMDLPAVGGIADLTTRLSSGSNTLIDGDEGRVYINPSEETLAYYARQRRRREKTRKGVIPPVTGFKVLANLERIEDLCLANSAQAEGIGLFRTEMEMLARQRALTEEEQLECYYRLLDGFSGPVCVRLLDLGADKAAGWLDMPAEENPALGCRGARFLLAHRELLQTQARALARASRKRQLNVLYPMVQGVDQFLALRLIFEGAINDIPNARLLHGVMFEVPSACLEASDLFNYIDFGRIGTNDLIQYLYAVDRMDNTIDQAELFKQPALWMLIEYVVSAAREAGKPVTLCGELAANPEFMQRVLLAGICEVSVCPRQIATLRRSAKALLNTIPMES